LVINPTGNTFEVTDSDGGVITSSELGVFTPGDVAQKVFELATPYLVADLPTLKTAQNADTMYVVHPSYPPRKLTRSGHSSWALFTYTRAADPFNAVDKYPSCVGFYEGRLAFGGTNNNPETLLLSRGPDNAGNPRYDDFQTGTNDDDAVIFTLAPANDKVDKIYWLSGNNQFLSVGTFGGITKVTGGTDDAPITPTGIQTKPIDAYGCANTTPISSGSVTIYIQRGNLIIRSFEYDSLAESFISVDRNLVSDHMTLSGVIQIAFQTGRPDILWCVKNNGELIGLTFKSREDVSGWHRHSFGGSDAKVISIGTIPQVGNHDRVWLAVERKVNGVVRRYIEYLTDAQTPPVEIDYFSSLPEWPGNRLIYRNELYESQKHFIHLDSSLTLDGGSRALNLGASLTPGATTGSSVIFIASTAIFNAGDVGNELWGKYTNLSGGGRARITTFVSSTEVVCEIVVDFASTATIFAGDWYVTFRRVSGLHHLEGETVGVVTDGGVHVDSLVTNGQILLDQETSVVHIGFRYVGIVKTMNLETGGSIGPGQTKVKNIINLGLRFHSTLGAFFGTDLENMHQIQFRRTDHLMGRPPPLFSGVKYETYFDQWTREKHLILVQIEPLPCTLQLLDIYNDATNE
jgi:hypothetical protein